MTQQKKLLRKLLSGSKNIKFSEMVSCVKGFGFRLDRIRGSHHIFVHPGIPELLNIQNAKGKAKLYQIKQFLQLIEKYNLQLEDDRE